MNVRAGAALPLVLTALAATAGFGPSASTAVAAVGVDPVMIAVGDIGCDPKSPAFNAGLGTATECQQRATSDLAVAAAPDKVAVLGDNVYECGSAGAFAGSYQPSWGRLKTITSPVVGNHEYKTAGQASTTTDCTTANAGAKGYFDYFGASAGTRGEGWYSYDLGSWHVVALNSNCSQVGGCSATSPQGQWLTADLKASAAACTLAYWHHPLFASGGKNNPAVLPLTKILYNAGAELVLAGHTHWYERFAPTDPTGVIDPARGLRELVIGSGGINHSLQPSASTVNPSSEVLNTDTFGVVRLALHPNSYDWEFQPIAGKRFTDSGSGTCHQAGPDTTAPSVPTGLTAQRTSTNRVALSWAASTDNVGVVGYRVLRNGTPIGYTNGGAATTFTDTKAPAGTTYTYTVQSYDASENQSQPSAPVSDPTAGGGGTGRTLTIVASADAKVVRGQASANFGSATGLTADSSPQVRSLLRFPVTGVGTGTVTKAVLRLWTTNASDVGGVFAGTLGDRPWTESDLTWNSQPTPGPAVASLGPVTAGGSVDVDVSRLVTADGTVDVSLTTTSADSVVYSSREATNAGRRPRLLVTVG